MYSRSQPQWLIGPGYSSYWSLLITLSEKKYSRTSLLVQCLDNFRVWPLDNWKSDSNGGRGSPLYILKTKIRSARFCFSSSVLRRRIRNAVGVCAVVRSADSWPSRWYHRVWMFPAEVVAFHWTRRGLLRSIQFSRFRFFGGKNNRVTAADKITCRLRRRRCRIADLDWFVAPA